MKKIILLTCLVASSIGLFAQAKKQLGLNDIFASGLFRPESVHGLRPMNDCEHYTSLDDDRGGEKNINKYSYKSGELIESLFEGSTFYDESGKTLGISSYEFSADEKKILIATDVEQIYRHSTQATYYVVDVASKKFTLLSSGGKQRLASFSPDASKVAFVRDNNIFIKDLQNNKETQITSDGKFNHIINGASDWVYEEEFGFDKAYQWSPQGGKLAYYKFDESQVKEFNMPTYGSLYPKDNFFKYPKAGEKNAVVSIHIYDVKSNNTLKANIKESYEYIPRIKWTNTDAALCVFSMNRHQNNLSLYSIDSKSGDAKVFYKEVSDTYIDIHDNLRFLKDNKSFIWTSDKSGYNHIYSIDMNTAKETQLTKGDWDVTDFMGIDQNKNLIYYVSAEQSPMHRDLYSIRTDGQKKQKLSKKNGNNSPVFNTCMTYYINYYSSANEPFYISVHEASGKELRMLKDNSTLKQNLSDYAASKVEFIKINTSPTTLLNGWMMKPADFDPNKKYPVLMFVYGGPGSQTVKDAWGSTNYLWYSYLNQQGYIVVSVDNRGTGGRGRDFKKSTYKQLGKYETEDQIEAATWLAHQLYIDRERIGIWGWSYGGYMSSNCITQGAHVFKAAIAVAPVTNWRFYDSIYTERYMQTPEENEEGYDSNSPINHVDKLKGKYLLIHGTADDNVHFQNAVEMVDALVKSNKQFDMMMYPDRNHGIYGGKTRLHLYTLMTNFILENL